MMSSRIWLTAAAAVLIVWGGNVQAQSRPVGQIDAASGLSRPSDATVTRADGSRAPARSLVRLYDGDRVIVTGETTRLTLFMAGLETPTVVTRANSPLTVRGRQTGTTGAFVSNVLASLDLMFNRPRMAIATATEARGIGDNLTPSPFLPSGPQILPEGRRPLLVQWSGLSSPVQINQQDVTREWPASQYTSTSGEAPDSGDFRIVLPGSSLSWSVTRVASNAFPRAPNAPTGRELTPDERLANAIWIMAEGAAEWQLFALSEITDLAGSDYTAARVLAAIRAEEVEPGDLLAKDVS